MNKEKLANLKENEKIIRVCLKRYSQKQIFEDLQVIDKKIEELNAKRNDVIVNRQNVSVIKIAQLKHQLKENKLKQVLLIDSDGLLKKLAKALKIIKETEKLVEV